MSVRRKHGRRVSHVGHSGAVGGRLFGLAVSQEAFGASQEAATFLPKVV